MFSKFVFLDHCLTWLQTQIIAPTMPQNREVEIISPSGDGGNVTEMSLTTQGDIQIWCAARTPVLEMDSIPTKVRFRGLTVPEVAHQICLQRLYEAYGNLLRDFSSTKCNFCAANCSQMIPQVGVRGIDSETHTFHFHAFMCPTCDNHVDEARQEMEQLHHFLQQLQRCGRE